MKNIEVICEIGKNFVTTPQEESQDELLKRAKNLIVAAKMAGADIAKFQCHVAEDEIYPDAHLISPHFDQDRLSWVKRNSYPAEFWWKIKEYCREAEIEFLATPMSRGAAMLLNEEIGMDRWKIGSGDILDFVMLDYIRDTNKPIILSSGMSSFEELKKSYDYLSEKADDISILHCVSAYPCLPEALNLNTISFLRKNFPKARIGFSDHSLGIESSLMAVQLGAEIIEKHFTFDRNAWGPDHKVSLLPDEMTRLIYRIKNDRLIKPTHRIMGIETKYIRDEEMGFRPIFRKGLYAARELREGEMISPDMIFALRPKLLVAHPSEDYPQFIGKSVLRDVPKYGIIEFVHDYESSL